MNVLDKITVCPCVSHFSVWQKYSRCLIFFIASIAPGQILKSQVNRSFTVTIVTLSVFGFYSGNPGAAVPVTCFISQGLAPLDSTGKHEKYDQKSVSQYAYLH